MEHERISTAFEQLVKNAKQKLIVKFYDNYRSKAPADLQRVVRHNSQILLSIIESDSPDLIAELIVKAEEEIDYLEKERTLVKIHDKAHPDLITRLRNINSYEGNSNSCYND